MADDVYKSFLDEVAIAVPFREVPHDLVLRFIADQEGDHHLKRGSFDKIVSAAGVRACIGMALVVHPDVSIGAIPPGWFFRSNERSLAAIFYPDYGPRPWAVDESNREKFYALARSPDVYNPCVTACARWGVDPALPGLEGLYPKGARHYPWGTSTRDPQDPGLVHGRYFANGTVEGTVAVAAGRLDGHVLCILPTRWIFDAQERADD
jgi:hypothetical protein